MGWEPRYTEEQVRDAVSGAISYADALRRLGLRSAGHNHRSIKRLVEHYGISVDHFDPNWANRVRNRERSVRPLAQVLVEHSTFNRGHLKRRLYAEGLKERRCEMCGQGEEWHGRQMSLILDHINGVATDNRLENLQIVCPNCAATLDTHCGRNRCLPREPVNCLRCGKPFEPKYPSHRYCSEYCGSRSRGPRAPRPERRKVERPLLEQLLQDLETMSYVAVGRKHGLSDNAVRKWLRWYRHEGERVGRPPTGIPSQP